MPESPVRQSTTITVQIHQTAATVAMAGVKSILPILTFFFLFIAVYASTALQSLDTGGDFAMFPPLGRRILETSTTTKNSTSTSHHNRNRKIWTWVVGFIVGIIVGATSGFITSVFFRLLVNFIQGRFRNPTGPAIYSPLIKKADDLKFLEKDNGVEGLDFIGRGGCGEVYRATLPGTEGNPGTVIAIKKIKKQQISDPTNYTGNVEESKLLEKGVRQLRSEINTVGHIRHRNLVPLMAHVARPDCNYLIYEYMKNGSLQDLLEKAADGTQELPWPTRLRIAQGVAAGLEYLHTQHSPRIIHRDLKPANILLDDDLEARITDFGLAKAIPDANTHMTTSNVAGTVGYIAPEYHQMLKFTDKCDVYSFGVILAVLVVGKMPSDDYFWNEGVGIVSWLRNIMKFGEGSVEVVEAIDANLRGNGFEEEMALVLKIACFCTSDDPKERPDSKDIRCMLNQIKHH